MGRGCARFGSVGRAGDRAGPARAPAPIASHRERIGAEATRLVLARLAGEATPRSVGAGFTLIKGASA